MKNIECITLEKSVNMFMFEEHGDQDLNLV